MPRNTIPPPPGPGRPKGSKNRLTVSAKEAFQLAYEGIGGAVALQKWAKNNETDFFKLYSKLIPTESTVTLNKHEDSLDALK